MHYVYTNQAFQKLLFIVFIVKKLDELFRLGGGHYFFYMCAKLTSMVKIIQKFSLKVNNMSVKL